MAKINAPLFSINSTGSLDKSITFRKKSNNQIASKYSKPGDKIPFESSPRQKDQRGIIGLITIAWQCKTDIDKSSWDTLAKEAKFKGTGYHYFLHLAKTDLTTYIALIAYWSFNYNTGNLIPDLSNNVNTGILLPTYPLNCPQEIDSISSKFGKARYFDGLNDYINCGNGASLRITGPLSLEVWLKATSMAGGSRILERVQWTPRRGYYLEGGGVTALNFTLHYNNTAYTVTGTNLPIGEWVHVVGVYNGTRIKIYFNAVQKADQPGPLAISDTSTTKNLNLGSQDGGWGYLNGSLDEVRIWNRELSPIEIYLHYKLFR